MQDTATEQYSELQDYLNHQQSWLEQELGEDLAAVLKEELEVD